MFVLPSKRIAPSLLKCSRTGCKKVLSSDGYCKNCQKKSRKVCNGIMLFRYLAF